MTWQQAITRARILAGRTGRRQTVRACRPFGQNSGLCGCGLWWVDDA